MAAAFESGVTGLLQAWSRGDANALERIVVLVYPELRRMAHRCLAGERRGDSWQSTALGPVASLRRVDIRSREWGDRASSEAEEPFASISTKR